MTRPAICDACDDRETKIMSNVTQGAPRSHHLGPTKAQRLLFGTSVENERQRPTTPSSLLSLERPIIDYLKRTCAVLSVSVALSVDYSI
jgi:hypothetical protein